MSNGQGDVCVLCARWFVFVLHKLNSDTATTRPRLWILHKGHGVYRGALQGAGIYFLAAASDPNVDVVAHISTGLLLLWQVPVTPEEGASWASRGPTEAHNSFFTVDWCLFLASCLPEMQNVLLMMITTTTTSLIQVLYLDKKSGKQSVCRPCLTLLDLDEMNRRSHSVPVLWCTCCCTPYCSSSL